MSRKIVNELAKSNIFTKPNNEQVISLPRQVTYCTIEEMMDDDLVVEISQGYSVCQPGDKYEKETGRQQALAMALDNLPEDLADNDIGFQYMYDNRPRQPKKVKPEVLRQVQVRTPRDPSKDDSAGGGASPQPAPENSDGDGATNPVSGV